MILRIVSCIFDYESSSAKRRRTWCLKMFLLGIYKNIFSSVHKDAMDDNNSH